MTGQTMTRKVWQTSPIKAWTLETQWPPLLRSNRTTCAKLTTISSRLPMISSCSGVVMKGMTLIRTKTRAIEPTRKRPLCETCFTRIILRKKASPSVSQSSAVSISGQTHASNFHILRIKSPKWLNLATKLLSTGPAMTSNHAFNVAHLNLKITEEF